MKFEILTEENFMGKGTESYLSDFGIVSGVKPYYDFSKKSLNQAYGSYLLDDPLETKDWYGRHKVVNYKGYVSKEYNLGYAYGIKLMIDFEDVKSKAQNFKSKKDYISFEFGTYPQKVVGKSEVFLKNIAKSELSRTEKTYYFYSDIERKILPLYEYVYNDKKYIFMKANLLPRTKTVSYEDGMPFDYIICDGHEILSDGNVYYNEEDLVFEVTPIKWILNPDTNKAFTKCILFGNIPFDQIEDFLKYNFTI